jgi:hypothetical protein
MGQNNRSIDEVWALGLGATTPMVMIGAKATSTMVHGPGGNDKEGGIYFGSGEILTAK